MPSLYTLSRLLPLATALWLAAAPDRVLATRSIWMADGELRTTFGGRTIDGIYNSGMPFTESYTVDGRLEYVEPQRRMAGKWSVVEGTFCTIYDSIPTGGCFRVRQLSENCYEFYFAAADEQEAVAAPSERLRWTARAWITERPSTCRVVPAV